MPWFCKKQEDHIFALETKASPTYFVLDAKASNQFLQLEAKASTSFFATEQEAVTTFSWLSKRALSSSARTSALMLQGSHYFHENLNITSNGEIDLFNVY